MRRLRPAPRALLQRRNRSKRRSRPPLLFPLRLTASTQTSPHFYLTIDCVIDTLLAAREQINASAPKNKEGKPNYKLSVNDFVVKALAVALQKIPNANVSWTEAGMLKHKHSDVGVAVALPGGLITPIVH